MAKYVILNCACASIYKHAPEVHDVSTTTHVPATTTVCRNSVPDLVTQEEHGFAAPVSFLLDTALISDPRHVHTGLITTKPAHSCAGDERPTNAPPAYLIYSLFEELLCSLFSTVALPLLNELCNSLYSSISISNGSSNFLKGVPNKFTGM